MKYLFIALAIVFAACSDNSVNSGIDPDTLESGKVICNYEGNEWKSSTGLFSTIGRYTSIAAPKNDSLELGNIAILIEDEIIKGYTYPATMEISEVRTINESKKLIAWFSVDKGCTVKIKTVSDDKISGSFKATIHNNLGDTAFVEQGLFNVNKLSL